MSSNRPRSRLSGCSTAIPKLSVLNRKLLIQKGYVLMYSELLEKIVALHNETR
ncbi:MAG: hypothetical protein OJF61_002383 [Rhodanobacteraceae bacterium]|jgi:hypothetical protein|nr:MAG: hypothetical protein OJF61_002383 [Rhodanobacteraceae bacterium]